MHSMVSISRIQHVFRSLRYGSVVIHTLDINSKHAIILFLIRIHPNNVPHGRYFGEQLIVVPSSFSDSTLSLDNITELIKVTSLIISMRSRCILKLNVMLWKRKSNCNVYSG